MNCALHGRAPIAGSRQAGDRLSPARGTAGLRACGTAGLRDCGTLGPTSIDLAVDPHSSARMDAGLVAACLILLAWYFHRQNAHVTLAAHQLNVCIGSWHVHVEWSNGLVFVCKPDPVQAQSRCTNLTQKRGRRRASPRVVPSHHRARPSKSNRGPRRSNQVRPGPTRSNLVQKKSFISEGVRDWFQSYGTANQINR